jgi:hypothetical protein
MNQFITAEMELELEYLDSMARLLGAMLAGLMIFSGTLMLTGVF